MNVYAYVHGDPINMRDPSGMCGWVLVDPEWYGGTWHYNECPDDVGVTGQRDGRISEDDFHWFQEHTHWDDGWDDWWDGTSAGIRQALDRSGVVTAVNTTFTDCNEADVQFGNFVRNIGYAGQSFSGVFTTLGISSAAVTGVTFGWSAPVTTPLAAGSFQAAGYAAVIGSSLDLIGASMQATGLKSWEPLNDLAVDWVSERMLKRHMPKFAELLGHTDSINSIISTAPQYSCEGR